MKKTWKSSCDEDFYSSFDLKKAAMEALSDKEYTVLSYRRGLDHNPVSTYARIAELLKTSMGAVQSAEDRATSKLKRYVHYHAMMQDYHDKLISGKEFPTTDMNIPVNIRNILHSIGIITAGDIAKLKSSELLRIRELGPKALNSIKAELSQLELKLKE